MRVLGEEMERTEIGMGEIGFGLVRLHEEVGMEGWGVKGVQGK